MSVIESHLPIETAPGELTLHYGWENHLAEQLVEKSQQLHVQEMTPEDAGEKFATVGKIESWRDARFSEDDPMIVWLGTAASELAGIAWIENAHNRPNLGRRIFGVRIYGGFQDEGLGMRLTHAVHDVFDKQNPGSQTQFTMLTTNNKAFSIGVNSGYKLDFSGSCTQVYIRNQ